MQQTAKERLGKDLQWPRTEDDRGTVDKRVAELLAAPLTMDAAVQVGGLHFNLARLLVLPMVSRMETRRLEQMQGRVAMSVLALAAQTRKAWVHAHDKPKDDAVRKEQKPWGIAGDAKAVTRTIEIRMSDKMRFTPDLISVREGETVRLVHRNGGKQLHEFVLGTKQELDAHAALMLKFPQMEHDEPCMAHVRAGKKGEMVWTFNRAGEFDFACLIPGHCQAGMVGKVRVAAR